MRDGRRAVIARSMPIGSLRGVFARARAPDGPDEPDAPTPLARGGLRTPSTGRRIAGRWHLHHRHSPLVELGAAECRMCRR